MTEVGQSLQSEQQEAQNKNITLQPLLNQKGDNIDQLSHQTKYEATENQKLNSNSSSQSGSQSSSGSSHSQPDSNSSHSSSQSEQKEEQWNQSNQIGQQKHQKQIKPIRQQYNSIEVYSSYDQENISNKPKRGNDAFKNFNPQFTIGENEDEESFENETRQQYRKGGRGGRRGKGGRGGSSDNGSGFGNRNGSFGNRDGDFGKGDGDRGRGRGGRGGFRDFNDRSNDRGGRGNFRGRGNFSRGFSNFDNRGQNFQFSNQRNLQTFNPLQNTNNFSNQMKNSHYENNNYPSQLTNLSSQRINPLMNPMMMANQPIKFPNGTQMTPQQLIQANFFAQMYGMDPQIAFKKKQAFGQINGSQLMVQSKVSNVTKKTKRSKKSKKAKESSFQESSETSQSSGDQKDQSILNLSSIIGSNEDEGFQSSKNQKHLKQLIKQKRADKHRYKTTKPISRKAWPSSLLFVIGNTFLITFRPITQHSDCLLAIPYKDTSMNIYPGKIIVRSQVDYRQKIKTKLQKKQVGPGLVYFQQNFLSSEYLYHALAFCLVDQNYETIVNIIKGLFASVVEKQKKLSYLNKILIPLSLLQGHEQHYDKLFETIISEMQKNKSIKQIILTTEKKDEWVKANEQFSKLIVSYIDKNQIWS